MRRIFALCLVAVLPTPVLAQEKKKEPGPIKIVELDRKDSVKYEKEIEPIFYKRCISCHSGNNKEGQFDISSYENLIKGGKSGSPVLPGKSDQSRLYRVCARIGKPRNGMGGPARHQAKRDHPTYGGRRVACQRQAAAHRQCDQQEGGSAVDQPEVRDQPQPRAHAPPDHQASCHQHRAGECQDVAPGGRDRIAR